MAEEDEIDILGDFNLDNFLSKSDAGIYENAPLVSQNADLLNCDYTIHPQWLLDKPSANPDCWYDSNSVLPDLPEKPEDIESLGHVSTENSITDESGWTEKEKSLLDRGIEIFGKSNVRLSQFIGSKTASEVKYYLKNFYTELHSNYTALSSRVEEININNLVSDILDDTQIPASIEEVIAAVSTAKPTVQANKRKKSSSVSGNSVESFKNGSSKSRIAKNKSKKAVKFKVKTRLKFPMSQVKQKTVKIMNRKVGKVEITTGKGLSVPICEGEEIVKLQKQESDSDLEVNIEDTDEIEVFKTEIKENNIKCGKKVKPLIDLSKLDNYLVKQLTSLDKPNQEEVINKDFVSELEKVVHSDYFEGKLAKTPLRYLKIRNHIINSWLNSRPAYVTKTSVRQGLKHCGDVNSIGRIHCYLEQVGVINFGCAQTSYVRPLYKAFEAVTPTVREKEVASQKSTLEMGSRPRTKRKFAGDGEGGCTLTHNEKGDVVNTTIVTEEPPKPKTHIKKPSIRLIYCRPFPENNPQKFKVKIYLTTLLTMDFHAHTSLTEIMGLVAGTWNPFKKVLTISHYEPCKNLGSSTTHCDMCPVSQSNAADVIHEQGLSILGWFHSHPTFAPEPSQQDLDTQQGVQMWIGSNKPCLGVILSPFSSHGALIASPFRCMVVDKKENFEDRYLPYKFNTEVISDEYNIEKYFRTLRKILQFDNDRCKVDFSKPYFQDNSITFLEKYVTSVRMHLAKNGTMNKMTCDYIIENINNICS